MATKPLPDQSTLLKLLRYEPETGKLFWRPRTPDQCPGPDKTAQATAFNVQFADREAMCSTDGRGYFQGWLIGRKYRTHRIIWKMVTGEEPQEIDHIDGDGSNNRWSNLRGVTKAENSKNRPMHCNNTSGCAGVSRARNLWRAKIVVRGKEISLGSFKDFEAAKAARMAAERRFGFHPNHGRASR